MRRLIPLLVTLAFMVPSAVQAAPFVIDNFKDPAVPAAFPQVVVGTTAFSQAAAPGNTIGGVRDGTVQATLITTAGVDNVIVTVGGGIYDYQSTSGADGKASLRYDGVAGPGSGNLNVDIGPGISIPFILSDSNVPLPVTVTLFDGVNTADVTKNFTSQIPPDLPSSLFFSAAEFLADNAAIQLNSINTIQIDFDPAQGRDFRLGGPGIEGGFEIPEPASIAVFAMVAVTGAYVSRRRRAGA